MRRLAARWARSVAAVLVSAVLVSAVLVLALVGLAPPASSQTPDAVSVARSLIAAENAHDVAAVLDLFAPGAIVNLTPGPLSTRAEIAAWQRELAAGNFHADTTTPVAVTPEVVTFSGSVAVDLFRGLGIAPLDATWQLTVQLGKVTTFNFDFTPAATARLGAAIAATGGATATPAAGGSSAGVSSAGSGATSGGSATAAPATAASASRPLALTGADLLVPSAAGASSVLAGLVLLLGTARRRRPSVAGSPGAGTPSGLVRPAQHPVRAG